MSTLPLFTVCGAGCEAERRKLAAHADLEARREPWITRGRRDGLAGGAS